MVPNFVVLSEYSVQSAFVQGRELRVFSSSHNCRDLLTAMKSHFYAKNKEMESAEQAEHEPRVDVATKDGNIGLVRAVRNARLEKIANLMYLQFRRNPSLKLLDVMLAELEDSDGGNDHWHEIDRFTFMCLEWVRNNE